uniref:Uncharacterized protein n=1 Tax=Anopheles atroparvus TaxID=41427 RepID=A0A182J0M1_ANOAO
MLFGGGRISIEPRPPPAPPWAMPFPLLFPLAVAPPLLTVIGDPADPLLLELPNCGCACCWMLSLFRMRFWLITSSMPGCRGGKGGGSACISPPDTTPPPRRSAGERGPPPPPPIPPPPPPPPSGLIHSGEPRKAAVGELISLASLDFFFVPRLSEDSERGKRDRKAGVVVVVLALFDGGCGCGNSGGVVTDEALYEGYAPV